MASLSIDPVVPTVLLHLVRLIVAFLCAYIGSQAARASDFLSGGASSSLLEEFDESLFPISPAGAVWGMLKGWLVADAVITAYLNQTVMRCFEVILMAAAASLVVADRRYAFSRAAMDDESKVLRLSPRMQRVVVNDAGLDIAAAVALFFGLILNLM
ncbi:hypothetical protein HDU96_006881 [Phlyctochytrium bullatum]|nr:hypothetical protein HDU96_006881 [Phlyctochytrium bullatum]